MFWGSDIKNEVKHFEDVLKCIMNRKHRFQQFSLKQTFSRNKEMMDYNTVVIVNDFRKEMFYVVLGFIYLS